MSSPSLSAYRRLLDEGAGEDWLARCRGTLEKALARLPESDPAAEAERAFGRMRLMRARPWPGQRSVLLAGHVLAGQVGEGSAGDGAGSGIVDRFGAGSLSYQPAQLGPNVSGLIRPAQAVLDQVHHGQG